MKMARSVEEVEEAVVQLPPDQLRKFRAWYEKFDSEVWDEQIEKDASSDRLDALAEASTTRAHHEIESSDT
jgi:hypothetical protein